MLYTSQLVTLSSDAAQAVTPHVALRTADVNPSRVVLLTAALGLVAALGRLLKAVISALAALVTVAAALGSIVVVIVAFFTLLMAALGLDLMSGFGSGG